MANTNEKITKRDRYETAIKIFEVADIAEDLREDMIAFAEHEIEILDNKATKAKETAQKSKASTDELADVVRGALTNDFQTINELVAKIDDPDVTAGKVQYRLRVLVDEGIVEKQDVSIPAATAGAKTRKLVAFRLIVVD